MERRRQCVKDQIVAPFSAHADLQQPIRQGQEALLPLLRSADSQVYKIAGRRHAGLARGRLCSDEP